MIGLTDDLNSPDPIRRAAAALYFAGLRDWQPDDLARTAGIDNPAEVYAELLARGDVREISLSPTRTRRVHRLTLEQLADRITATMHKMHELNPLRSTLDRKKIVSSFRYVERAATVAGEVRLVELPISVARPA